MASQGDTPTDSKDNAVKTEVKRDTAVAPGNNTMMGPGATRKRGRGGMGGGGGGRWQNPRGGFGGGGGSGNNSSGGNYGGKFNSGSNNHDNQRNNQGDQNSSGNQNSGGDGNDQDSNAKRRRLPPNNRQSNNPNRDREFERINERLQAISGPTLDLPQVDTAEKKFSCGSRLYIGNLTNDVTEEEITELFKPYGETSELFLNKEKLFAFIRLDFHSNAERAKRDLDGQMRKGRPVKVRYAPNASSIRVKNLTPFVTNELLHAAFSVFGDIDRCVVIVDERGKSTCEGIVEFARKPAALCAIRRCSENCFFLTSSLRPVIVEPYEIYDDVDGFTEKSMGPKKSPDWYKARDKGPRFAMPGSFEHEYGTRWKQLSEIYKQKMEALKREQTMEEEKLEAQMEYARYEHETEMLREQLRAREMDKERQKREWELRERAVEEEKIRGEEQMRRMQEDMVSRMSHQEEDLRRRQEENSLFLKAQQLTSFLDQQERLESTSNKDSGSGMQQDNKYMDNYGNNRGNNDHMNDNRMNDNRLTNDNRMGDMDNRMGGGNRGGYDNNMRGNRQWGGGGGDFRRDNFQNKRRRY